MMIDERTLAESLHSLEMDVAPDLAARVRRGGQRRLLRRRAQVAAGVAAVGAASVPVGIAVRTQVNASHISAASDASLSDLYAPPPAPGSTCTEGTSGAAAAAAYPQLLLLPPGQDVTYAHVRRGKSDCSPPHVALTLLHTAGDQVTRGLVLEGPNAPTAIEAGFGPGSNPVGGTGSQPVQGSAAEEFTVDRHTDVYWTGPDGAQWHAEMTGVTQADAVVLLDGLTLDSHAGTATVPSSAAQDWTVAAPAADAPSGLEGSVESEWVDSNGHTVDLNVSAVPNRIDQQAATAQLGATFVTVNGQRGEVVSDPRTATVGWQAGDNVEADVTVLGGTAAEAEQIAASVRLTAPDDPRFNQD